MPHTFSLPPPEARCKWIFRENDPKGRAGEQCPNWGCKREDGTRKNCKGHGGTNPGRPLITGEYSKNKFSILERMTALGDNRDLQDQGNNLRILTVLLEKKLALVDGAEPQYQTWARAEKRMAKLKKAIASADAGAILEHSSALEALLSEGHSVASTERDLRQIIQEHKSVAETADKKQMALLSMMPVRKLGELVINISNILKQELVDNGVVPNGSALLARIQGRIRGLVLESSSERARS